MELKTYLRTLARKWHIVVIVFVITYGATLALTMTRVPIYQGRATFVVKLNSTFANDKDLASAVDILSRRTEIATTYTTVANSRLLKRQAMDALGLTREQRALLSVSSELVPGTNVLEVLGEAPTPELARDFTNAVGAQTMLYAKDLYETYRLEPLDQANAPDTPIRPNKPLDLTLGAIMGLVLGIGCAFLATYLQAPPQMLGDVHVVDDDIGVYNKQYFALRLRQEVSRARRNSYPLAVALINVDQLGVLDQADPQIRSEALRDVAARLRSALREEDVMAVYSGTTFALLLPDVTATAALELLGTIQNTLESGPIHLKQSGMQFNLYSLAALTNYTNPHMEAEDLLNKAVRALRDAEHAAAETAHPSLLNGSRRQLIIAKANSNE